jgi:heat-inducible transcriptional repressor
MTGRQRQLLHLLVDTYIQTQSPVASGVLAEQLSLSPATVRYDLIELEQLNLIAKPHTSAGRIPTRAGFRHYAISKLPPTPLPQSTVDKLIQALDGAAKREMMVVQVASRLSGYPAILRLKPHRTPKLLQVHLSLLAPGKVLAVAVLEGGRIREARIDLSFSPTPEQLSDAERNPLQNTDTSLSMYELLTAIQRAFSQSTSEEFREGVSLLLAEPEAQDPAFLRQALSVFESQSDTTLTPPGGMNVRIGEDIGLSMVQTGVAFSDQVGELSLLGPMRMRYTHALSVAYALGQVYTGK